MPPNVKGMMQQGICSDCDGNGPYPRGALDSARKSHKQCRSPICYDHACGIFRLLACLWMSTTLGLAAGQPTAASWRGALRDARGVRLSGATIELRSEKASRVLI
ncbi:MAG: hypothetical protein DMG05_25620, partial [Acidobacteria bacterium]